MHEANMLNYSQINIKCEFFCHVAAVRMSAWTTGEKLPHDETKQAREETSRQVQTQRVEICQKIRQLIC